MRRHESRWLAIGVALATTATLAGCTHKLTLRRNEVRTDVDRTPFPTVSDKSPQRAAQTEIALAEQYINASDYEIALDKLQRALKFDPDSADAYTMLGLLYERINRPDQAEASYAKSVKLAPTRGAILNNYGAWQCHSGHPADADVWFRKAIADPFYKTPMAALGNAAACAIKAGKPELAESYDRQILTLDPVNAGALQDLASLLYKRGDYLHARAFVERLLAAAQVTPNTLDLAARIEDKLGDAEAAGGYRKRIASEFPQYTPAGN